VTEDRTCRWFELAIRDLFVGIVRSTTVGVNSKLDTGDN